MTLTIGIRLLLTLLLTLLILVGLLTAQRSGGMRTGWRETLRSVKTLALGERLLLGFTILLFLLLLWSDLPSWEAVTSEDQHAADPSGPLLWGGRWEFSDFWARHTLWAGLLSTLAPAGVIYFMWQLAENRKEEAEERRQERLAVNLSSAGLAGIVDYLNDAEILLAAACLESENRARELLETEAVGSYDPSKTDLRKYRTKAARNPDEDVRLFAFSMPADSNAWRQRLVDTAIRRIAKAMNEWAPLITQSVHGRTALDHLAEIRISAMKVAAYLAGPLHAAPVCAELRKELVHVRRRLRFFALFFEKCSGHEHARSDVLLNGTPLSGAGVGTEWIALPFTLDRDAREVSMPEEWARAWQSTNRILGFEWGIQLGEAAPMGRGNQFQG